MLELLSDVAGILWLAGMLGLSSTLRVHHRNLEIGSSLRNLPTIEGVMMNRLLIPGMVVFVPTWLMQLLPLPYTVPSAMIVEVVLVALAVLMSAVLIVKGREARERPGRLPYSAVGRYGWALGLALPVGFVAIDLLPLT